LLDEKLKMKDERQTKRSFKHNDRYDFKALVESYPALSTFVFINQYGSETVDFANPDAVKTLNKALLIHFYNLENWDIPNGYLCPPIPGRANYLHHLADLLARSNHGKIPQGQAVKGLDIGTGANVIYPIIGQAEYGWSFVGSDIDSIAITAAQQNINTNQYLKTNIELRLQNTPKHIFNGIISPKERFDFTICNPPFHASAKEAAAGTQRKIKNLKGEKTIKPVLNFGGQNHELWCEGGEEKFIQNMIHESQAFANNCFWFTTLVAKSNNLRLIYKTLKKVKPTDIQTIEMKQGNKVTRFVAWTFLDKKQQGLWRQVRF
jgi:23S rRNA (adenine1618-N6)-methyltransferase